MWVLHITDVTITTGSTRKKKQQAATIQISNEGTNTRSREVDNTLVRRKDFKNFKEEEFKQNFNEF
jgi:hypothetical protein